MRAVRRHVADAAAAGARLVLLPEACLTGLVNNDDPAHDLKLGVTAASPVIRSLAELSRRHRLWLGIGLLERSGRSLYDSAFLFSPAGRLALRYRRVSRGWHGRRADRSRVYRHGTSVRQVSTGIGRVAFLLCGDLFDKALVARVRELSPDLLLVPIARSYAGKRDSWRRHEVSAYGAQARAAGAATLVVNSLAAPGIPSRETGAAMAYSRSGRLLGSLAPKTPGILLVDLPRRRH